MKNHIYICHGQYFGFVYNDRLFDMISRYLVWIESREVYRKNGAFLSGIVYNNYIL